MTAFIIFLIYLAFLIIDYRTSLKPAEKREKRIYYTLVGLGFISLGVYVVLSNIFAISHNAQTLAHFLLE